MNFICQNICMDQLQEFAKSKRHSILIEGIEGSGKTYLAKQYAYMINVPDFQIVEPTVCSVRVAIEECSKLDTPIVLCIENLDKGLAAASYALLKFLEEPASNIYIVVTCRSINKIPDTIISRSVCVSTAPPIDVDIIEYAKNRNLERYEELCNHTLWKCVNTFKLADIVLNMSNNQISYFDSFYEMLRFKDCVSNIVWKLGHYDDNTETPIDLVIRFIISITDDAHIKQCGMDCIHDILLGRIATHAVLSKFVLECKYGI